MASSHANRRQTICPFSPLADQAHAVHYCRRFQHAVQHICTFACYVHPDELLQWLAAKALTPIKNSELRRVAMQHIEVGNMANGVALLVNNVEPGDFAWYSSRLPRLANPDDTHHLVRELLDLCEAHPGGDALACLLYVYELSPCSTCRRRAVKALIDTHIAPVWILTEAAFDADPDTRSLAKAMSDADTVLL